MAKTELQNLKHNVHEVAGKEVIRVQADIDKKVFDYFFMHVIAYTHGARQAIITFFFQRLYEECKDQGIPEVWDEENSQKVLEILNRLNFNEPRTRKPSKPARSWRTNSSLVVSQRKPDGFADVRSAANWLD